MSYILIELLEGIVSNTNLSWISWEPNLNCTFIVSFILVGLARTCNGNVTELIKSKDGEQEKFCVMSPSIFTINKRIAVYIPVDLS